MTRRFSRVPCDSTGNRIRAAALYCSDGRFGGPIDDFLHNGLKLPRCDRLVAPGGAAALAGHFLAFREEDGLFEQLRFLIRVHDLTRLVLIAHQDCAYLCRAAARAASRNWKRGSGRTCKRPPSGSARSAAVW